MKVATRSPSTPLRPSLSPRRAEQEEQARILNRALSVIVINPAQPYAPQVIEMLRDAILTLRLKPGTPLSEAAVSTALGVSRTPVREALRDLSVIGLIDIFPQAGTMVAPIRMRLITQEIFVREALEGANLVDVMGRLDASGRDRIQALIDRQGVSLQTGDIDAFFANDEAMHRLMFELTDRLPVWTLVNQAKQHIDRARRLVTRDNLALSKSAYQEHLMIVRALFDQDLAALREALHGHMLSVAQAVLDFNITADEAWVIE